MQQSFDLGLIALEFRLDGLRQKGIAELQDTAPNPFVGTALAADSSSYATEQCEHYDSGKRNDVESARKKCMVNVSLLLPHNRGD